MTQGRAAWPAAALLVLAACGGVPGESAARPSVAAPGSASAAPTGTATPGPTATPDPTPDPAGIYAGTRAGMLSEAVADIPPRVYVPHEESGTVVVIDPATFQVINRFPAGTLTHHITPSWDLTRLYVNNMASDTLTEIDAATGQVIGNVTVARPYNLYYTPDGSTTIVVAEPLNQLDFYERATWRHIKSLPLPFSGIDHLDFAADGSYLLVSSEFDGWVIKVDLTTLEIAGQLEVGGLPIDIKASPDGSVFYVANQGRHGVSIVDPVAMAEIGFLPTGRGAHGLAVSRDATALYVSNRLEGTISVIDFATRSVVATWPVGGTPDMLNVSTDGRQLWTSNRYANTVSVIDTSNGGVLAVIVVDEAPHGLTYFPQPGSFSIGHNGVYR